MYDSDGDRTIDPGPVHRPGVHLAPVVEAIDQVGTPWRLNVVYALGHGGPRRTEPATPGD